MLNSFFRGLLGTEESPTKVLEVRSDQYLSRPIHYREDSMLLYGPKTPPDNKNPRDKYYEIVLHKPFTESLHQMYSLFRAEQRDVAEEKFLVFKERVPLYIKITKECTVASLQKLCELLSEHSSWSIAHIVAHFGLYELFNDPEVQKRIDEVDPSTGATPLMVAVKTCNVRMVQSLVSLNCCLDSVDAEGNTVFHYAAASNKEIINALYQVNKTASSLNVFNKQGHTPLHMACLANAPDCVRALMLAGADVNLTAAKRSASSLPGIVGDILQDNQPKLYQQDMKYGGTPLHWAISREVIEALADKNCDINALNFDHRTALHIMVLRGRLECAIALLSRGAELDLGDKDGNTPLHLAAKLSNISMVQALVVFGADLEALNNAGQTARHLVPVEMTNSNFDKILYVLHAVGATRCSSSVAGCSVGCSSRGDYNGVPPPLVPGQPTRDVISQMLSVAAMERAACMDASQKQGRLLSLDGGGIRGLVLVQMLLSLEQAVEKPIIHCFDWVAGTSTGGILALALACGKTLRECQRLYFRMKEFAFVGMRPYPSEALETILKECLGTETLMSDIKHPKLMILAVLADRKPVDLHIFRNYASAQVILDKHNGTSSPCQEAGDNVSVVSLPEPPPPSEQLVWQAARATGAAPSYFRASGRYLDGGLMGNNPTLDALTEISELRLAMRATGDEDAAKLTNLKIVVSCGTGLIPVSKLKDIDVFKPESIWDTARLAMGLNAIGKLLVDQATQSDGRVVERARAWCSILGAPYYRFAPQMSRDVAMDERLDDRLVTMLWEAQAYMRENRDRVAELAALLNDSGEAVSYLSSTADVAMDERLDDRLVTMLWEAQAYMRENRDRVAELAALLNDSGEAVSYLSSTADVAMDERLDDRLVTMLWEAQAYMRENRDRVAELAALLNDSGEAVSYLSSTADVAMDERLDDRLVTMLWEAQAYMRENRDRVAELAALLNDSGEAVSYLSSTADVAMDERLDDRLVTMLWEAQAYMRENRDRVAELAALLNDSGEAVSYLSSTADVAMDERLDDRLVTMLWEAQAYMRENRDRVAELAALLNDSGEAVSYLSSTADVAMDERLDDRLVTMLWEAQAYMRENRDRVAELAALLNDSGEAVSYLSSTADVAMDERLDDRLVTMLWEAQAYMRENRDRVAELAALLNDSGEAVSYLSSTADVAMDERLDDRLVTMLWEAQAYMRENRDRVAELAALLNDSGEAVSYLSSTADVAMDERLDDRLVTMLWEAQAYMRENRDRVAELAALLNDSGEAVSYLSSTADVAMDERLDDRLVTMLWEAQAYMRENRDRVAELAALLNDSGEAMSS